MPASMAAPLLLLLLLLAATGANAAVRPSVRPAVRPATRPATPAADYRREERPLARRRSRPIEWREINLLHLTDVHSFVAGNRHEGVDADYGDLTSFVRHMHDQADARGVDVFVLNTGDLVDGTGMSDATPVAGEFLAPILQRIPYDGLTIGNHELYEDSTVDNLRDSGFLGAFGARVVTSNQQYSGSGAPIGGSRATVLEGRNGARLLAFGFLFDFTGTSPGTHVERVADAVAEPWFAEAVTAHVEAVDAIVVLAHMGWTDSAIEVIRAAIRAVAPDPRSAAAIPIAFLAGHTHVRAFRRLDDHAAVLESGRYFDCLGLISFTPDDQRTWFEYDYLATNVENLQQLSETTPETFPTAEGAVVKAEIQAVRDAFGLDEVIGCTPPDSGVERYRRASDLAQEDSLWRLALTEVIPAAVFSPPRNSSQVLIAGSGGIRYDIFEGDVTRDDTMIVSPFRDQFHSFVSLAASEVTAVLESLGAAVPGESRLPSLVATSSPAPALAPEQGQSFDLIALDYDLARVRDAVRAATGDPDRSEIPYRHGEIDSTDIWETWVREAWSEGCIRE